MLEPSVNRWPHKDKDIFPSSVQVNEIKVKLRSGKQYHIWKDKKTCQCLNMAHAAAIPDTAKYIPTTTANITYILNDPHRLGGTRWLPSEPFELAPPLENHNWRFMIPAEQKYWPKCDCQDTLLPDGRRPSQTAPHPGIPPDGVVSVRGVSSERRRSLFLAGPAATATATARAGFPAAAV